MPSAGSLEILEDGHGDGRAQQTEDQRHGGRGGEPQRVVEPQQDDVGEHNAQIEHHHFVEGEQPGVEHAAAGHLHHTARRGDADQDARRGDREDGFDRGRFGAEGRAEEVDGVVGDAHEEAGDGQQAEDADDDGVDFAHRCEFGATGKQM